MEFLVGGKLEIGDVVIVPWAYRSLNIGIYAGEGKNTQRWWDIHNVISWELFKAKKPSVNYIRRYDNWSMVKISIDTITNYELRNNVEIALKVLKERKLI